MRTWLGTVLLLVLGTFVVMSGCGSPDVVRHNQGGFDTNGGDGGDSGAGNRTGSGATSGGFVIGEGGDQSNGCPSTCEQLNANCGVVTDARCTGVIECGTCADGQFCGGDGPSRCGTGTGEGGACNGVNCVNCVPKTCKDLGFTCGPAGDTCGGKLDCGSNTCAIPGWTCGGGAKPGVCGCTGVCSQIPDCSAEAIKTTSLTGKVYDPAGVNPLYHVFVYVANNPDDPDLKTFPKGITCDVCGSTAAGSPALNADGSTGAYTDESGTFTLTNVPVGKDITVVIQLGRWRRVFKYDVTTACAPNVVPDKLFAMPKNQSQGNIPLMAMVTGDADSLECVLRKIGIDASEFTNPADGGRVQFYLGSDLTGLKTGGRYGQKINVDTPQQSELFKNDASGQPVLNGYDMTILACQGGAFTQAAADLKTLRSYAAAGGRVFATHYSYTWLTGNDANTTQKGVADNWSEVAKWRVDENDRADTGVGIIDLVSNPKGKAFQGWLEAVGASPGVAGTPGTADLVVLRHDADSISSVSGQTQQWMYRNGVNSRKCSVSGVNCVTNADCTPARACAATAAACTNNADCKRYCRNKPAPFPVCTQDADCAGAAGDCATQNCNNNTCVGTNYTGTTLPLHFTFNTPVNLVQDLNATPPAVQCGRVLFSDFHVSTANEHDLIFPAQCDNKPMNAQEKLLEFLIFDLGSCVPPPTECKPKNTCPAGADCGYAPDGCGGLVSCGVCPTGEACGVGSPPVPNKCGKGTQTCIPLTCAAQHLECGPAADGCGAKIDSCGVCAAGELCVMGKCAHVN